jgi:hypothetical protein
MALHHPVYQVNQAIGAGGLGAFESLFHWGISVFSIPGLATRLRRHLLTLGPLGEQAREGNADGRSEKWRSEHGAE